MAEELVQVSGSKEAVYSNILAQIKGLVGDEKDVIANLANVSAALSTTFNFLWVGFYIVKEDELVLGPFQGPIACTRIQLGRGVCGKSWEEAQTIIVDDVDQFPGHITCSSSSKSEIVVPLIRDKEVIAVLDVDSDEFATFDAIDAKYLNELCEWLVTVI
ncbi:MAG: L-methionine (R)-S-oxide reductase [Flavobacteriaceae bacterium]|jgi:L-methionine (R)-S-oxide reductase